MTKKEELIQSLQKVKIIIGNGFDLHCGRKTSYRNYFTSDNKKLNILQELFNDFKTSIYKVETNYFKNTVKEVFYLHKISEYNFFDFYFFIESKDENHGFYDWYWCDVESSLKSFLKNETLLDSIFRIVNSGDGFYAYDTVETCFYATCVMFLNSFESFDSMNQMYNFFLNELKRFECNFISYLHDIGIHCDERLDDDTYQTEFRKKAIYTIKQLCNPNNIQSIDTFNFGNLNLKEFDGLLHHINGDLDSPIFGIDSKSFKSDSYEYIFTKTCRRIENDMVDFYSRPFNDNFENIVIYGHSLNDADYSYFFGIFDKVEISDLSNSFKVVFAFSIYSKEKEETIRRNLRISISSLFENYAKYLKMEDPQRLLDSLTALGKVIVLQVY